MICDCQLEDGTCERIKEENERNRTNAIRNSNGMQKQQIRYLLLFMQDKKLQD